MPFGRPGGLSDEALRKKGEGFHLYLQVPKAGRCHLTAYGLTRAGIFASRRNAFTSSFKLLDAAPLYRATADLGRFF